MSADGDDSDDSYGGDSSTTTHDTPARQKTKHIAIAGHAYDRHLASMYPYKIMIVEDNDILRKLMASLLQKLGYEPANLVLCSNGQEAVDYFVSRSPKDYDVDLILMDCWMPVMDGIDATRKILEMFPVAGLSSKKRFPGIKPDIVAITADALPANLERSQKAGMRGYMVKPIKLNDLQRVVEESAEGNW
jgi:CheY-like chemotaxis protein